MDHNVDTRRLAPTSSHVRPTQHALAAYRLPSTNGEPFHHRHRPTAMCIHQHPCTPNTTRVGYMTSPHHQGRALPPQPSTHGDMRPPAPMYANTRRVGCISSPHHQRRVLPSPPSTHGDVHSPAPIYAQHETRWRHIESPPPTTRPAITAIDPWRRALTSTHLRPTRDALAAYRVPTTNDERIRLPNSHERPPTTDNVP